MHQVATGDFSIADKIVHTGDTNTALRFPAADTFTVETGGTEAIRVDSSQRLLVNTATTRSNYDNGSVSSNLLHVERTSASGNAGISICANAETAADVGAILYMGRTSATSNGANTIVENNDLLGRISFQGADGSQLVEAASIKVDVDGSPGANDMPGRIEFHTTADGASSATERLRITSAGNFNFLGNLVNVNATGVSSFVQLDVSTGGLDVDGQTDLDELQVAGVSTFSAKAVFNTAYPSIDADNEIQVGTAIQLGKAGVITATSFSGSGANLTGIAATDHVSTFDLVVAGISTFNDDVRILAGGLNVTGVVTATTFVGNLTGDVTGTASNASGATGDFSIADKIIHTGDTNTALRFPAADTFTVETSGAEALRIDSSGRALFGTTTSRAVGGVTGSLQLEGTTFATSSMSLMNNSDDTNPAFITLGKSKGGSLGSNTVVASNDYLGIIKFVGADGTDAATEAARIECRVDGTPGSNDMPGRLIFSTTADGAASATERLRITAAGLVRVPDEGKITFGAGDDLKIYHSATQGHSFIQDEGTGNLYIDANQLYLRNADTDNVLLQTTAAGVVQIKHNGNTRFETTTDGADFSGTGGVKLPVGSTAQRPGSPTAGDLRYNSDDGAFEGYTDSWGAIGGGTPEVDTNVSSTSVVGVGSFATASFRSAEVIAQIVQIDEYQVGKYLMIHDGTTVTVIEQAAVSTGDAMIGSFDGAINGSNAELRVTMVSSGIATVTTKISTVTV